MTDIVEGGRAMSYEFDSKIAALELELGEMRGRIDAFMELIAGYEAQRRETERALFVAEQAHAATNECPPGNDSWSDCPDHGDCVKCWGAHIRGER